VQAAANGLGDDRAVGQAVARNSSVPSLDPGGHDDDLESREGLGLEGGQIAG
jgi:hypothetical protein